MQLCAVYLCVLPAEIALAKQLLKLPEILHDVERDLFPSQLCEYIFDLSAKFNYFYEHCPVQRAETDDLKSSRLALCSLTAGVLKRSLDLLGIPVLDKL